MHIRFRLQTSRPCVSVANLKPKPGEMFAFYFEATDQRCFAHLIWTQTVTQVDQDVLEM